MKHFCSLNASSLLSCHLAEVVVLITSLALLSPEVLNKLTSLQLVAQLSKQILTLSVEHRAGAMSPLLSDVFRYNVNLW